ncbi:hypothetical protein X743_14950 [Mesorhizobium sp. LNHC252B00]|uniref:hypothetical protein n=1 Tax=Mesorhizobium sp. LNHC252B00 TaxID=1287252 RepID=UPI0003CF40B2|nr:hypothetical protein [Mesorhizobium sp. LNHC252B00]ESY72801.1 hypothetical protein X743_14950 [Mesorhizobium sp. LNHC252B00]
MPKRPVIFDQKAIDLQRIDGEIQRLGKHIAEKQEIFAADTAKHALDQNTDLQARLKAETKVLRGHVDKLNKERFDIELGELAEPKQKAATTAASAPIPVQRRAWEIEPTPEPTYPAMVRTPENHRVFADALQGFIDHAIYKKNLTLKDVGCHPDQRAHMDLVATISAQGEATFTWLSHRCAALEARLQALETKPPSSERVNAEPLKRSVTKILKHDDKGRIEEFEKVEGQAEEIDIHARLERVEKTLAQVQGGGIRYAGVWTKDTRYPVGSFVTHGGSMWCAKVESTGSRPGESGLCWQLAVKAGRKDRAA